jgi:hypothetical protein
MTAPIMKEFDKGENARKSGKMAKRQPGWIALCSAVILAGDMYTPDSGDSSRAVFPRKLEATA